MPRKAKTPKSAKRLAAIAAKTADVPRQVYNIQEFCAAHRISPSLYYKMRNAGVGPREIRVLEKPLITRQAAADWLKARESEPA
jgi:hypothetical protein